MNEEIKIPKPAFERITLQPKAKEKTERWLEQATHSIRGLNLSKSDLVNWLVESHADELSPEMLTRLRDAYFDEVKFTAWALGQLKEARERGESLTLSELLSVAQPTVEAKPRVRRKRREAKERGRGHEFAEGKDNA